NDEIEDKLKVKVKHPGFSVPEHYFDQLTERIQTKVSMEKLKDLSAGEGFAVPASYFEQLEARIKEKTTTVKSKKEAGIFRLWRSDIVKYASAACFVLVSAFGLYMNNHRSIPAAKSTDIATEQNLFDIDEQMIIDHIQANKNVKTTTNASEKELEDYILNNYSQTDIASNL
ncbi:hypothetical protein DBR11_10210, partial [Pedobacter sp. HMWF019]